MLSCFSHVPLFVTLWTVAGQAPLSMGFPRQEYWSGLPFPSPGIFPTWAFNPGLPHCGLRGKEIEALSICLLRSLSEQKYAIKESKERGSTWRQHWGLRSQQMFVGWETFTGLWDWWLEWAHWRGRDGGGTFEGQAGVGAVKQQRLACWIRAETVLPF